MLIGLIVQNYKLVMKTTSTPFWSLFMNLFKLEIEPVLDNATGQLFLGNPLNILSYLHRLLKSFTFSQEKQDLNTEKSTNCYH